MLMNTFDKQIVYHFIWAIYFSIQDFFFQYKLLISAPKDF